MKTSLKSPPQLTHTSHPSPKASILLEQKIPIGERSKSPWSASLPSIQSVKVIFLFVISHVITLTLNPFRICVFCGVFDSNCFDLFRHVRFSFYLLLRFLNVCTSSISCSFSQLILLAAYCFRIRVLVVVKFNRDFSNSICIFC